MTGQTKPFPARINGSVKPFPTPPTISRRIRNNVELPEQPAVDVPTPRLAVHADDAAQVVRLPFLFLSSNFSRNLSIKQLPDGKQTFDRSPIEAHVRMVPESPTTPDKGAFIHDVPIALPGEVPISARVFVPANTSMSRPRCHSSRT